MKQHLGMYVHQHWGYNNPYSARTWSVEDWRGYLGGLKELGYNMVMVWPVLETIPDPPTASDIAHLKKLREVIDIAHSEYNMPVLVTLGPNTVGNEKAARYSFEERPFFETDRRLNPADEKEVAHLMRVRRELLGYLSNADGAVMIDSDPGGYIGSTNSEFTDLFTRHMELITELNPSSVLYYWMWVGWEAYNRFWEEAQNSDKPPVFQFSESDCEAVVGELARRPDEPWRLFACCEMHERVVEKFGAQDRTILLAYGTVEGEPTFPLTNLYVDRIAEVMARLNAKDGYTGIMVNSQTHAVQQPNAYLVSHFFKGETTETVDLAGFAEGLIPGLGDAVAEAWRALESRKPDDMRAAAGILSKAIEQPLSVGRNGGLIFGEPKRFVQDLVLQLTFIADAVVFNATVEDQDYHREQLRALVDSWSAWQARTGFRDAYFGPIMQILHPALRKLNEPHINAVLDDFDDWRDPSVRNGIVVRLIEALRELL